MSYAVRVKYEGLPFEEDVLFAYFRLAVDCISFKHNFFLTVRTDNHRALTYKKTKEKNNV